MYVLSKLVAAISNRQGLVTETADLIENQVPAGVQRGSFEHAQFLFTIVPSDRGVKSASLWERAARLYESHRWLFDATSYADETNDLDRSSRVYDAILHGLKPRYAKPAADGIIRNSKRLSLDFAADPRRVFSSGTTGVDSYTAIRSFIGFGPKTGGMMYRAAVGLGWASPNGAQEIEIPVDTHDVRIAWQVGVLVVSSPPDATTHQSLAPAVRRELTAACKQLGVDWFDIDRALWLIGSRGCARGRCSACPLREDCVVGRVKDLEPVQPSLAI